MKLPAVAIVTAFASGIAIGFWPALVNRLSSPPFLSIECGAALAFLVLATISLSRQHMRLAGMFSLATWLTLGT